MLEIDIESKKGILFVRMDGELNKNTISKWNYDVKDLIEDAGIRNIVFNVSKLTSIDTKGIHSLLYGYEVSKLNKGVSVLCGVNEFIKKNIEKSRILKYMKTADDEMVALSMIEI